MPKMMRALATVLAAAALAATSGALVPSPEAVAADACVDGFRLVATNGKVRPQGVSAVSATTALMAGAAPTGFSTRGARILALSGGKWSTVSKRSLPGDSGYVALGGTGQTGRWAVGFARTSTSVRPLIGRKVSGRPWKAYDTAGTLPSRTFLTDVDTARKKLAWAVGYRMGAPGRFRPVALRWNGSRWVARNPGLRNGETGSLASVSTHASGGTWIAGSTRYRGVERPYIARLGGGSWSRVPLPKVGEGVVAGISVTARDEGWAVGYRLGPGAEAPLILHWDGTAWKLVEPPFEWQGPAILLDVSVTGSGKVAVAGTAWARAAKRMNGVVLRLEDGTWSRHLLRLSHDTALTSVAGDPSGWGWAAGTSLKAGVIVKTCQGPAPAGVRKATREARSTAIKSASAAGVAVLDDEFAALPPARGGLPRAPRLAIGVGAAEASGRAEAGAAGAAGAGPGVAAAGGVRMVDRAAAAGLPTRSMTWGAVIADFDGDGRKDIFLGRHGTKARLYLDRGATFKASGVDFGWGDRHGCAVADVDGSGLPDLYCTFGGALGQGVTTNELWLDPGGPEPRLHPLVGGAPEPLGRGRRAAFVDADDDGSSDLFVGSMPTRVDGLPSANRVYLRGGPASFHPLKDAGIDRGEGALTVDVSDFDRDGRQDLLLTYWDPRAASGRSGIRLYRNTPGGFRDVKGPWGVRSIGERDAELVKLDGDSRPDLVQISENRIRVSLQRGGKFQKVYERTISGAVAVAAGDADGDGDRDLYVLRDKPSTSIKDTILFNRGGGRSYRAVPVPSRSGGGKADDVFPIDHDQNGLTDFLVLNGRGSSGGSVQLISFYR